MKIMYCAYRQWALDVVWDNLICSNSVFEKQLHTYIVSNGENFRQHVEEFNPDVIFLAGWSWIVPDDVCESRLVVGMHPSNLPDYAGGSPIQNQVIDGIDDTYACLIQITPKLDGGPIIYREAFSLSGDLSDIFKELTRVTETFFNRLIEDYPNIPKSPQNGTHRCVKRLKPTDSELTREKLTWMTSRELWNHTRCRTGAEGYPEPYIEDEHGRFVITGARFEPSK